MTRLRGLATATCCLFVLTCVLIAGVARPAEHASVGVILQRHANPLVVLAKDKCRLKVKCDAYALASACRKPPCCKKWHLEKVCEANDGGQGGQSKKSSGDDAPNPPKPSRLKSKTLICPAG